MKVRSRVLMIILSGLLLWSVFPVAADNKVVFAYSADGSPVSYSPNIRNTPTDKVLGFCGELFDYLASEGYELTAKGIEVYERFEVFAGTLQGDAGIQCGPDSLTRGRQQTLNAVDGSFVGEFSKTFFVTSTKLLIRATGVEAMYENSAQLRIGVLEAPDGSFPVTNALIAGVFSTATIVPLSSRAMALERLVLAVDDSRAIDAYASDEVILADMLHKDIKKWYPEKWQDFRIEPPLYGYSREEYVLAVYNAPQLLEKVNVWLDSDQGQAAIGQLELETDTFVKSLQWLARGDRLMFTRMLLSAVAALSALLVGFVLWRSRRASARSQSHPVLVEKRSDKASELEVEPVVDKPLMAANVSLTPRELEVLTLLIKGNSNKEIARELGGISPRTIETHRKNIYTKLGVSAPVELVEYARQNGLL